MESAELIEPVKQRPLLFESGRRATKMLRGKVEHGKKLQESWELMVSMIWVCCCMFLVMKVGFFYSGGRARRNTVAPDAASTMVLLPASLNINSSLNNIIIIGLCVETG
jgi:hypothetical protein